MSKELQIKQLKTIALLLSKFYQYNLKIEINVQTKEKQAKVSIKECNL